MSKRILRTLCLLLCLVLLPIWAQAASDESAAPNVRVLLRRLELTDRADLILDGVYTAAVEGKVVMAFPQGSKVTALIRDGELYLFYQGMSLNVGKGVTFIRNANGEGARTGIRFERNGGLYPGHLALSIRDGALYPVCTMSVEDYLLGVVPYEMSDSFPLEALKAQAVCARTYALKKLNSSKDYDLVDTTNDQVFKGVNYNYTNAVRAVQETAGVVGTWKGELAQCYYSASNGGQTELVENVWSGRGDWGYYQMVDDPYDLENPESIVRRASIDKEGLIGPALESELFIAAIPMLREQGFIPVPEYFRVDGVTAVELGHAAYAPPSRSYERLTITFNYSGRMMEMPAPVTPAPTPEEEFYFFATPEPTATPPHTATPMPAEAPDPEGVLSDFIAASEPITVTLDIFPSLIDDLGLSIYGADNELITVTETEDAFILESRRYGHGVGMSQRGAQWMAGSYGKSFTEILAFYYPGMELMQVQSGSPVLPTVPANLAATPAPPATPTPRPTLMPASTDDLPEGAWVAQVTEIDRDSSLNLRQEPTQAAEILRRLYYGQTLIVLESCEDPQWVHVRTDVMEGYVMVSFLTPVEDGTPVPSASPATPGPSATPAPSSAPAPTE